MKVIDLDKVLNTDEYIFINDVTEESEIIRDYEKGSHLAIKKYFEKTVKSVTPCGNAVEIRFI